MDSGTDGDAHEARAMEFANLAIRFQIEGDHQAARQAWLDALDLRPTEIGRLRSLPVEQLVEATRAEDPVLGGGLYFGPVMDDRLLTRHPFYPDAPPLSADIPMIIGNTREETLAFLGNDPANQGLTWDSLPARLTPAQLRIDVAPEQVIAFYRDLYPQMSPDEVLIRATTAGRSWRPT